MKVCDVAFCQLSAAWWCSGGFRYCKEHKRPHGPGKDEPKHTFRRYRAAVK